MIIMSYFWQDLGRLLWKFFKAIIVIAGIFFFSLIIYFRPDMYVKNIFQDLKELKVARENFEEKNEKIINEVKKLNKEIEILKRENIKQIKEKENLQRQIEELTKIIDELEKSKEQNKEENLKF